MLSSQLVHWPTRILASGVRPTGQNGQYRCAIIVRYVVCSKEPGGLLSGGSRSESLFGVDSISDNRRLSIPIRSQKLEGQTNAMAMVNSLADAQAANRQQVRRRLEKSEPGHCSQRPKRSENHHESRSPPGVFATDGRLRLNAE